MTDPPRPCDNPFNAQQLDQLPYVEHEYELKQLADRLRKHRYRGAICGPHGCGKSALLQALGDQLMEHGLTPLSLFTNTDHNGRLPAPWVRTIRRARPTDVLLLDGYDLLPIRARAWVLYTSRRAGGVVVTAHRRLILPRTIARPTPSPALLQRLIDQLAPSSCDAINPEKLYAEAQGNLREALRRAYDLFSETSGQPLQSQTHTQATDDRQDACRT